MAARMFNAKAALEREIKDLYLKITAGAKTAATAEWETTEPIILTSVAVGDARNTQTVTLVVEAAAANPTDTILAVFTGTAAAITVTITPNDGTNNSATPVDLTTEELVELINDGSVVGKTVSVTDASSLRALQTATGGDTTALAAAGEGDGEVATFSGGAVANPTIVSGVGVTSVTRDTAGAYTINLANKWPSLRYFRGVLLDSTARDYQFQLKTNSVTTGSVSFIARIGATATDLADDSSVLIKLELKNSSTAN